MYTGREIKQKVIEALRQNGPMSFDRLAECVGMQKVPSGTIGAAQSVRARRRTRLGLALAHLVRRGVVVRGPDRQYRIQTDSAPTNGAQQSARVEVHSDPLTHEGIIRVEYTLDGEQWLPLPLSSHIRLYVGQGLPKWETWSVTIRNVLGLRLWYQGKDEPTEQVFSGLDYSLVVS